MWGLAAGTIAVWVVTAFWLALGFSPMVSFLAAMLTVTMPLFWFNASRPLSDVPGLVVAVAVQAGLLSGWRAVREAGSGFPRVWIAAAFGVGLAVGLRSQSLLLTGPLLIWIAADLTSRGRMRDAGRLIGLAAGGVLVWAVPLIWLSGGLRGYLGSVTSQGLQDLNGVELVATMGSRRLLQLALVRTFIQPWQLPVLAGAVLSLALAGAITLLRKRRHPLAVLAVCALPYLAFHLLLQETVTTRYALPLVVPIVGLAVVALSILPRLSAAAGTAAVAMASLIVVLPPIEAYAAQGSPIFRAFEDMLRAKVRMEPPPLLRMHHQVWWGVLRELEWYRPLWDTGPQPFPGDREWLAVVRHFASGSTQPVWFLSDVTRTDMALFDPRARIFHGRYEPPPDVRAELTGIRLDSLSWWSIGRPSWMLGTGWALTPEVAGMTALDQNGPARQPADGYLLRSGALRRLLIGGRYLGPADGAPVVVSVQLDGRPLGDFRASAADPWFVQWIDLPDGVPAGPDAYAHLTVRAQSADPDRPATTVGLEQFDASAADDVSCAFVEGWQEAEEDPATGQQWRWTSARSTLVIRGGAGRDLQLRLTGESPLKNFDRAPDVVIRAGDREVGRFQPSSDFDEVVALPSAVVAAAGGQVTIATDRTFVPADREKTADRRTLGLKLYGVSVTVR